jgi:L-alanine-DL-glutamate epimerase-like enolase superfamily enzyme
MRIRRAAWLSYRVPFVVPFSTAYEGMTHRRGVIVCLSVEGGPAGLGEAAPLAGFGGSFEQGLQAVQALLPQIRGHTGEAVPERLVFDRVPFGPGAAGGYGWNEPRKYSPSRSKEIVKHGLGAAPLRGRCL